MKLQELAPQQIFELTAELFDPKTQARFYRTPVEFHILLKGNDAAVILLSYLCNHYRATGGVAKGKRGGVESARKTGEWFFCEQKKVTRDLMWSPDKERRVFGVLIKKNLIETRKENRAKPRRMIRIKWEVIRRRIEKYTTRQIELSDFDSIVKEKRKELRRLTKNYPEWELKLIREQINKELRRNGKQTAQI